MHSITMASIKLFFHYTIAYLFKLFLIPLIILTSKKASKLTLSDLQNNLLTLTLLSSLTIFTSILYLVTRPRPIYLVDFCCYLPPPHLKVSISKTIEAFDQIRKSNPNWSSISDQTSLDFLRKIQERSGLGDETYSSEGLLHLPPLQNLAAAREETEQVIFSTLENLFECTNVNPRDIGILVVNCSVFNPTPSLSAVVVNKFKLRSNIKSFNLGGMGCSAGIIAIDLAKDLLHVHKNTYALVISTENVTKNVYSGDNKSMMVTNCLFRLGGAAILLSNNVRDRKRSKYRLAYTVRTHTGADDKSFQCVQQEDDEKGLTGVCLTKDVTFVAGKTVKANIRALAPLILPLSEKLLFFVSAIGAKVLKEKIKLYVPDFKLAIDHFCIHAGGRGVIDVLEKNLGLFPQDVEASRSTLHRFGNTSSSSVWYELAYIEAKGRMKKGDKVWQIGLGSGFKCNSAVWVALCNVKASRNSPWQDCIDRYPIDMSLVNGRS